MSTLGTLHRDAGVTVLLITHEHDIAAHAQRTLVVRDGRLIEETTT